MSPVDRELPPGDGLETGVPIVSRVAGLDEELERGTDRLLGGTPGQSVAQRRRIGPAPVAERLEDALDERAFRVGAVDQEVLEVDVGARMEEDALGRQSVAPGTARLLVIGLEAPREVVVNDEPHVFLVDAEPEGVRRDDDPRLAAEPPILGPPPLLGREARVVEDGPPGNSRLEPSRDALARLARPPVNDCRPGRDARERPLERRLLVRLARAGGDREAEVRPVEAAHEDPVVGLEPEPARDLAPDELGRRRRHGEDGRTPERFARLGEPEVVRAEVVTPVGDAVRLVHREEGHLKTGERLAKALAAPALGRHVEELDLAPRDEREDPILLLPVLRAVEEGRLEPPRPELVHLVLHQGDERRDGDRGPGEEERRELVEERLAPAGREDGEHVLPVEHRLDDLPLAIAEGRVAEEVA